MTGAISNKLLLFTPVAASSGIFAFRRAERGIDNMDEKPIFGTANLFIAGGQIVKAIDPAKNITDKSKSVSNINISAASDKFKAAGKSTKFAKACSGFSNIFGGIFRVISDIINPAICVASSIKVLESDDKADAAVREILGLGTMFTCERGAKYILGWMKKVEKNGMPESIYEPSILTKNQYIKNNITDKVLAETKLYKKIISNPSLKGPIKGVLFVLASVGGYKLGSKLADIALGTTENKKNK